MKSISIIIHTLNAERNIGHLIERINAIMFYHNIRYEIIIVDDHSTDNTRQRVKYFAQRFPIRLELNKNSRGKAQSLLEGFAYAQYDLLCTIDADLQYSPEKIPTMLEKIDRGADVVVANRVRKNTNFIQNLFSRGSNYFTRKMLHGLDVDIHSGLKVFKKEIIERVKITPSSSTFHFEFLKKSLDAGYSIESIDMDTEKKEVKNTKITLVKKDDEQKVIKKKTQQKEIVPVKQTKLPPKENEPNKIEEFFSMNMQFIIVILATYGALIATSISYANGWILAYADAEMHLTIAKKVVSGLTPSFSQISEISLNNMPMLPLVAFDSLWRTGLAGSIVSGFFYVLSSLYIFKLTKLITKKTFAAFIAFTVFATNLNILYFQSTPLPEIPLIAFFVLSTYYFVKYLYKENIRNSLILAGFFAFCASLTRYDGLFLLIFEALIILISGLLQRNFLSKRKKDTLLFTTLAGFWVLFFLVWNWIFPGGQSQQTGLLIKEEFPAYHNVLLSLIYYVYASLMNSGIVLFLLSFIGSIIFIANRSSKTKLATLAILFVPFIYNVVSLFFGQKVILIPDLTPDHLPQHLFNVRYGVMMMPFIAIFFGYLIAQVHVSLRILLIGLLIAQSALFYSGALPVISFSDGTSGLSANKTLTNVEGFINLNYDGGLVLIDDRAKIISITKSTIPMQKIIYVGNKPYWEESLKNPERYARFIIMQKGDAVWSAMYDNETVHRNLDKYFKNVYTSNTVNIFKRIEK